MDRAANRSESKPAPVTWGLRLTGLAGRMAIRLLGSTLRFSILGEEHVAEARAASPSGQIAFAAWHGSQLPVLYRWRGCGAVIMASLSRDGSLQDLVLSGLGYRVVRGSTSRGSVRGMVGMIRSLRSGHDAAFAVDGPRGPFHVVQPGVLYLASRARLPVLPVAAAASPKKVLDKAWDRYLVPAPFARVVLAYGEPLQVRRGLAAKELAELSGELALRMERLERAAEDALDPWRGTG